MRAAMICTNASWTDTGLPIRAVVAGLQQLGLKVVPVSLGDWPIFSALPDVAFIWNGARGRRGQIASELRRRGVPVLIMERGFFDRLNHTQIDHAGFNHTASWAARISQVPPAAGVRRFAELTRTIGRPIPTRRPDGDGDDAGKYILILGQTPCDSQLHDSEIHHPDCLVSAIENTAPPGVELRFRGHPMNDWRPDGTSRTKAVEGSLGEALRAARFAITINSNSGNDALLRGCSVLCLGPALYGIAGVAVQTPLASLQRNIELMLNGWRPDFRRVLSYFHWLAARQWTADELACGEPLRDLLHQAGVTLE